MFNENAKGLEDIPEIRSTNITMTLTFDSPNSDLFAAPVRLSVQPQKKFPFRETLTAVIYEEQYCQRQEFFEPLALDTLHPEISGAYLVGETNPKADKGGLVKWTRVFATVPGNRTEFQTSNFTFPAYRTDSDSTEQLRSAFSQTCVAKSIYSYLLTTDPGSDLTITPIFQPTDASSNKVNFVASDTTPNKSAYEAFVVAGTYIQAAETKVKRWKGNIWVMQNLQVKAL